MLACIYDESGAVKTVNRDKPECNSHNIIIRVLAASICGTDLRAYKFGSSRISPPRIIGHEVVGRVTEVGDNVKDYISGELIQIAPAIGCGKCKMCKVGKTNLCDDMKTVGFQFDGTFCEYMELSSEILASGNVQKIPDTDIGYDELVLAEPIACVINAQEYLNISMDETVAIIGAGFIGCIHAELAILKGASKVFMIELNDERRKEGQKLLPDLVWIDPSSGHVDTQIINGTDGDGVDNTIVACSVGAAQKTAMDITGKKGKISLFGGLPGDSTCFVDSNIVHYKEISVYGVHASTADHNKMAMEYLINKQLNVKKYISSFNLNDIINAFEASIRGDIMKAVIKP